MQIRIQVVRGPERPRSRKRRLLVAAAVVAAVATVPVAYAAVSSDIFTDVPSTAGDHDAINRVYQAGIMTPCNSTPMQFCPNNTVIRRGEARHYDYALGLSGQPGNFTPTFRGANLKTGGDAPPLTIDSRAHVALLNSDLLDGNDSSDFERNDDVLYANVSSTGALLSGDATSSTMNTPGDYTVTFTRDISMCAATVSAGTTNGAGGPADNAATGIANTGSGGPAAVNVQFHHYQPPVNPAVLTGFHLVVTCGQAAATARGR